MRKEYKAVTLHFQGPAALSSLVVECPFWYVELSVPYSRLVTDHWNTSVEISCQCKLS